MIVKILADLYCVAITESPLVYRLYIDNDLYTERTFIWNKPTDYINEESHALLEPGSHTIRVESCHNLYPDGFVLRNITVDGKQVSQTFTI